MGKKKLAVTPPLVSKSKEFSNPRKADSSATGFKNRRRKETSGGVKKVFIHPTAEVSKKAKIGAGTKVWAFAQISEGAVIGRDCVIGNGVYIDRGVKIGDRVNIHNKALLYRNLTVEDDVFIGPAVCFVNDPYPRSYVIRNMSGLMRTVKKGASIGANATILSDINIGSFAMIGAGSVISKHVPDHALVYGAPGRIHGQAPPRKKGRDG